jgi:hypothetical protein
MLIKAKKSKRAQSILEYLGVMAVFTTLGVGAFMMANKEAALTRAGTEGTYYSEDTWRGQTLAGGVDHETVTWPEEWNGAVGNQPGESDWTPADESGFTGADEED